MKISIYKEEELFIQFIGGTTNPMVTFFIHKEFINEYNITPDSAVQDRHYLEYLFGEKSYLVNIDSFIAEAILNGYKIDLLEE